MYINAPRADSMYKYRIVKLDRLRPRSASYPFINKHPNGHNGFLHEPIEQDANERSGG